MMNRQEEILIPFPTGQFHNMKDIYLHLQLQEEDEDDEDMDGSEDGTASPSASEDEQQEGNVYKWCKNVGIMDIPHKQKNL
jgi:hypothetical protein